MADGTVRASSSSATWIRPIPSSMPGRSAGQVISLSLASPGCILVILDLIRVSMH